MELSNFLNLLKKQKFILIAVPIIAVMLTYFLVRHLPDSYASRGSMATGLVDASQQQLINKISFDQESKSNQQFDNLIQMMQLKKIFDQVSYKLIIHDLAGDTPFHKASKLVGYLNKDARKHAIEVYSQKYNSREPLSLWDRDQYGLNDVINSMGYDFESLKKKLSIYRLNNSDFIDLEFESDNAMLSAFVINTLCKEFIAYYSLLVKENQVKAISFLDSMLKTKRLAMNGEVQDLQGYKIQNRVLNLNDQVKSLYGQIADFETKKEGNERDIIAYTGVIKSIDDKFNPRDRKYLESSLIKINQDIIQTKESLKQLTDLYIKSNYDPHYKSGIDSLKSLLTSQINESTDKYILNPLAAKENLVTQKINLEVSLDMAKNSVNTLNEELARLNQKFDKLVPHEAIIQSYENAIDVANKEYIEILQKFNQTSIESNLPLRLRQIEIAMPGTKQASKKMILVVLSGLLSFVFCMIVFFILFYLDHSIKISKELANQTGITVLGFLPMMSKSVLDLKKIWDTDSDKQKNNFKNLLRSVRFEIETEMQDAKLLMVTSLEAGEGKTLFAFSLAYAYSMINKKVLLIDGNFGDPKITSTAKSGLFLEDYLSNKISLQEIQKENNVNILCTKGGDISLFELSAENTVKEKLQSLKAVFDIVIVEISALDTLNKSKEWIVFADKVVAVFEANQSLSFSKMQEVNYLKTLGNKFIGWVMNKAGEGKSPGANKIAWYRKNKKI